MPAPTGLYGNIGAVSPMTAFDELKRNVAALAQQPSPGPRGRPLTDVDWNDYQMIMLTLMRRLAAFGVRNAALDDYTFLVVESDINNTFKLRGGGTVTDAAAPYIVGGLPAIIPYSSMYFHTVGEDGARWVHHKWTSIEATKLHDTSLNLKSGSLTGRTLYVMQNNGTTYSSYTISDNGTNWIQISGSFNLGTGGSQVDNGSTTQVGTRYYVGLTTPGAARTDRVWLDLYLDEVAAARATGDPHFDEDLNHNIQGTPLESMRRLRIVQQVWVEENTPSTPGANWIQGGLTGLDAVDGVYTYNDTDGNPHYCVQLAKLTRQAESTIRQAYIADTREVGGRGALRKFEDTLDAVIGNTVISSNGCYPEFTGSATKIQIGAGSVYVGGRMRMVWATEFTGPTDGTGTWGTDSYVAYVDAEAKLCVVAGTSFPTSTVGICKFEATAGVLSDLDDDRKFSYRMIDSFKLDRLYQITTPLKVNVDKGGEYDIVNNGGETLAKLYSAGDYTRLKAVKSTERLRLESANGNVTVDLDTTDDAVWITADKIGLSDVACADKDDEQFQMTGARAPGVRYGTPATALPISPSLVVVPAAAGMVNWACSLNSGFLAYTLDGDTLRFDVSVAPSPDLGTGWDVWSCPLPLPKGVHLTKLEWIFDNAITTAGAWQFDFYLDYRNSYSPTTAQVFSAPYYGNIASLSGKTYSDSVRQGVTAEYVEPALEPNPHRVLIARVKRIKNGCSAAGSADNNLYFLGVRATCAVYGEGNPNIDEDLVASFVGL